MEFYWLAVFEELTTISVPQPDLSAQTLQAMAQRWSRSGVVAIAPGQDTQDVVKDIVTTCKTDGGIPGQALLVNIVFLPNRLVP
jgi:hypothetical protein